MTTAVQMSPDKLVKYLSIGIAQRKRAYTKALQEYGATSAVTVEINAEINELQQETTNLIKQIQRAK